MIPDLPTQPLPDWLQNAACPLGEIPLDELLSGSVYYPAAQFDGQPVRFLAGNFHSFVYVDYGVGRNAMVEQLTTFRGYATLAYRDVTQGELTPRGWQPQYPGPADGERVFSNGPLGILPPSKIIDPPISARQISSDSPRASYSPQVNALFQNSGVQNSVRWGQIQYRLFLACRPLWAATGFGERRSLCDRHDGLRSQSKYEQIGELGIDRMPGQALPKRYSCW